MLEEFYKDEEIREYLNYFPKDHWKKSIYLALLYGIRQIKEKKYLKKINYLENILANPGKTPRKSVKNPRGHESNVPKTYKLYQNNLTAPTESKENLLVKVLSSPGNNSEKKPRTMPKYLKNVESKIKLSVQKDLANYKKEFFSSPKSNTAVDLEAPTNITELLCSPIEKSDSQIPLPVKNYKKELFSSPKYKRKYNRSLPDLLEVVEPKIYPIEKLKNHPNEPDIGKIAERFLSNPYTRILSPL
jgi:hypothetical protein